MHAAGFREPPPPSFLARRPTASHLCPQVRNEGRYGISDYERYIKELKAAYPDIYVRARYRQRRDTRLAGCDCRAWSVHPAAAAAAHAWPALTWLPRTRPSCAGQAHAVCHRRRSLSGASRVGAWCSRGEQGASLPAPALAQAIGPPSPPVPAQFVAFEGRATPHTPVFKVREAQHSLQRFQLAAARRSAAPAGGGCRAPLLVHATHAGSAAPLQGVDLFCFSASADKITEVEGAPHGGGGKRFAGWV